MQQHSARRLAVACALVAAGGTWLPAQQPAPPPPGPQPTFQTGTDIVRLEVSVLDKDRQPVRGLTAADFTVREDGRDRPVVAFTQVELPPAASPMPVASWVRDAPRDVVDNAHVNEGRLVVIAFDWSIRSYDQRLARSIAHAAIDGLGPRDQASVIFLDPAANAGVPQNFTSDRALLRAAIDRPFATALIDLLPTGGNEWKIADPERYDSGGCHCGRCTLDTLARVATTLRDVSQRPKVVFFVGTYVRTYEAPMGQRRTEPIPGRITPGAALQPSACNVPLSEARDTLERAMREANATIHVLDPVGLDTPQTTPLGRADRMRERLDSLPVIADLTGGRTVLSTNAPELHVPAILAESSSYYVLGFTPATTTPDGRSHRIDVRVNRRDISVKARDRYTRAAPRASVVDAADAGLIETMGGVLPGAGVPFEAAVAPFAAGTDEAATIVVVGRVDIPSSVPPQPITLLSAAFTPRGRAEGSKRTTLTPEPGGARSASTVLGVVSGLALVPGLHEIRLAAELASGTAGSVSTFVDVPDFRRDRLSMSGVLIRIDPAEPVEPREDANRLPFTPTARRTFQRTDVVSAFVQTSQGTTRTDVLQPVTLHVRIVDTQDRVVRDQSLVLGPDAFATNRTADSRLALPVQNLAPGEYLLSIDATMDERTTGRAVRFEVR